MNGTSEPRARHRNAARRAASAVRLLIVAAVLAAAAFLVFRWATSVPEVRTAAAAHSELESSFTAEGVVRGTLYTLSAETGGRVTAVAVREGQRVAAGDLVVSLAGDPQAAAVSGAEAAHHKALADVDQADAQIVSIQRQHDAAVVAARAAVRAARLRHAEFLQGARPEEVEQARQTLARARAALEDARTEHQRTEALVALGALPRAALDKASAALRAAQADERRARAALAALEAGPTDAAIAASQANVDAANAELVRVQSQGADVGVAQRARQAALAVVAQTRAALEQARSVLGQQRIESPTDGVVVRLDVEPGAVVVPGAPVLTVATRKDLRVEAEIGTDDAAKVHEGMAVTISAPAYPGRTFAGRVRKVMPAGELKPDVAVRTRIVRAEIELLEPDDRFFPGMEVDVQGAALLGSGLAVPSDALLYDGDQTRVLVVRDGRVEERKIAIGVQNPDLTQVLSGLQAGERVIVDGKEAVAPGDRVRERR
ncbi:MAG: efflux RND transporter periplasmic adaptor subunit [Chthonomonadaceae bacterium]|nr:efflux RND transporter periplasmic adaptor subunit [Chthonomonadaceae bacterium]